MNLGTFINSIPGAFIISNSEFASVYVSNQAEKFFSISKKSLKKFDLGKSIHFHNEEVFSYIQDMKINSTHSFDDVIYSDQGFESRVNVKVKKVSENSKIYYLWLFFDFSEELKSQQEMIDFMADLNAAKAKIQDYATDIEVFKNIINNINQGILLTNESGKLIFSNDFASKLFAFDKTSIMLDDIFSSFTHSADMSFDEMRVAVKSGFLKNEVLILDKNNENERRCYLTVFCINLEDDIKTLVWNFVEIDKELENTQALIDFTTELNVLNDELKKKNKQILYYSRVDALTGAYNRGFLFENLNQQIQRAKRSGKDLCLIIIDADKFKNVNDTYGHLAGDLVLKSITQVIKELLPKGCFLGRYGGEEFIIIMPLYDLYDSKDFAEKIRKAIEASNCDYKGKKINITISAGVSKFLLEDDADTLINRADAALYFAKKSGRNQVVSE